MARRLPRHRLLRAFVKSGTILERDAPQIEKRMMDPIRAKALNDHVLTHRGGRFIDKMTALITWLIRHRETILNILGFVIMFAEDGSPKLVDKDEYDAEQAKAEKEAAEKARKDGVTPDGEKVEDFLNPELGEPHDEVPVLVTNESVISREAAEKCMDELVKMNEDAGLYDLGANALSKEEFDEMSDDDLREYADYDLGSNG